jgi:hypothetical protein
MDAQMQLTMVHPLTCAIAAAAATAVVVVVVVVVVVWAQAVGSDPSHIPGLVSAACALEQCGRFRSALAYSHAAYTILCAMQAWFPHCHAQLATTLTQVCTNHLRVLARSCLSANTGDATEAVLSTLATMTSTGTSALSSASRLQRAVAVAMVRNSSSRILSFSPRRDLESPPLRHVSPGSLCNRPNRSSHCSAAG